MSGEQEMAAPAEPFVYDGAGHGSPRAAASPAAAAAQRQQREEEEYEEYEDERTDLGFAFRSLVALIKPVAITMLLTVLMAVHLVEDDDADAVGLGAYQASDEDAQESDTDKLGAAAINALVFVAAIIVATLLLVFCYWRRWFKGLYAWLIISVIALLGGTGGFLLVRIVNKIDVPVDIFSFTLVLYNFAVIGCTTVFWRGPDMVKQGYLVLVSAIMAFILVLLPPWTTWAFLIALSIYDLCAVLTPCGPLKCLIEMAQERDEAIPALLYEAHPNRGVLPAAGAAAAAGGGAAAVATQQQQQQSKGARSSSGDADAAQASYAAVPAASPAGGAPLAGGVHASSSSSNLASQQKAAPQQQQQQAVNPDELDDFDPERSVKLGLGDFVMYSVLVGRAAIDTGFATTVTSFIAVLAGLAATLTYLAIFRKALPALPVSIAWGVTFYFLTRVTINPFMDEFVIDGVWGA